MRFTRESDLRILAGLHWAMARKADKLAALAREHLAQGDKVMPASSMDRYDEDMPECRRIAKILAHP